MGGVGVALADDLFGVQQNPAALGRLWRHEVSLSHTEWLEQTNYQYAGAAYATERRGAVAVSLFRMDYGDIQGVSAGGAPTSTLEASDILGQISYGKALSDRFSAGGTVKYMREKLHTESAAAAAGDAGLSYVLPFGGWLSSGRLGLAVTNVGSRVKFIEEEAELPRTVTAGLALRPFFEGLPVAADVSFPRGEDPAAKVGVEYWARGVAALRLGYAAPSDSGDGLGFGLGVKAWNTQIDYAYAGFAALGQTHHLSLTWRFGSVAEAHYQRGMEALRGGDYAGAIVSFSRAVSLDPSHRRALQKIREANQMLQNAP